MIIEFSAYIIIIYYREMLQEFLHFKFAGRIYKCNKWVGFEGCTWSWEGLGGDKIAWPSCYLPKSRWCICGQDYWARRLDRLAFSSFWAFLSTFCGSGAWGLLLPPCGVQITRFWTFLIIPVYKWYPGQVRCLCSIDAHVEVIYTFGSGQFDPSNCTSDMHNVIY